MKLAVIAHSIETADDYRKAGIARYTTAIIDAFADMPGKDEFHLYMMPDAPIPDKWRDAAHFRIHRIWRRYNKWMQGPAALQMRLGGQRWSFSPSFRPPCQFIPSLPLVRRSVMIHDLFPLTHPQYFDARTRGYFESVLPFACHRAELLFANSESTKSEILRLFGGDPGRIVVTPLGPGNVIEPVSYGSVTGEELIRIGVPFNRYFFTLSTIEPRKNLPRLIQGLARLRENAEFADVGLVVGGGKGWLYEEVFAEVDRLGLADAVAFLGYVKSEDLPALFGRCEAYVCASVTEGFGMPVLEAMIAGAPIVTSNGGALPEVGADAALYFDPEDPDAIAEGLRLALEADREILSRRSLERARHFSWDKTARATLDALRSRGA
ncbi:MAG TPA: glycosyltransferase family 1 protein [Fimbriimonadaceae bacterium]|nr:glycosyltransferase family 1 protein [Fimbriimonadaceae bacterium]HRJ96289.1 glycosyltransferase family 1 protein [Fimbriimonadaceae bacterium]